MLFIKTDLNDISWLRYIIGEFIYIKRPNFNIHIVRLNEDIPENVKIINYVSNKPLNNSFFRATKYNIKKIIYLDEKRFIFDYTKSHNKKDFLLSYDPFLNAFLFLSRKEERIHKDIRSYAFRHIRRAKNTFLIPIVNIIFNDIEHAILKCYPELNFNEKRENIILHTHDVDYIKATPQMIIKRLPFKVKDIFYNLLYKKSIKKPIFLNIFNDYYNEFYSWINIDKKFKRKSIFFIYGGKSPNPISSFLKWILDPTYDIKRDKRLTNILKNLIEDNIEIGLHSSFFTYNNKKLLLYELKRLKENLGIDITSVRQHWLNYDDDITPYLHEELFEYDFTIGFNDKIGLRSGIACEYHPYDHKNRCRFNHKVIPLVYMDSMIGYYKDVIAFKRDYSILMDNLNTLKSYKVSFNFHLRGLRMGFSKKDLFLDYS